MNADQLREIRERHAMLDGCAPMAWSQTEADRAALLAEVDRLKALCGRAAAYFGAGATDIDCGEPDCEDCKYPRLVAELRESK